MKVCIVTGANGDIGLSITKKLLADQSLVFAQYLGQAVELLDLERSIGGQLKTWELDFKQKNAAQELFDRVLSLHPLPNVLINNAGIMSALVSPSHSNYEKIWLETFKINLYVPATLMSLFANYLAEKNEHGRIINITSRAAHQGDEKIFMHYAATKAALQNSTKTFARQYGGKGIYAFAIAPGFIKTGMTAGFLEENEKAVLSQIPMNRLGSPDEVANLTCFIANGCIDYCNGATFDINGGSYVR